jgi:hypothetical protein
MIKNNNDLTAELPDSPNGVEPAWQCPVKETDPLGMKCTLERR